jgi:hypothetical protein
MGFPVVDTVRYLPLSHPSLAKPSSPFARLADIILDELREHLYSYSIINTLRDLVAFPTKRDLYIRDNIDAVANIVQRLRPELSEEDFNRKVANILIDFLYEFHKRPLRNLNFEEALKTYTERQFGEEH